MVSKLGFSAPSRRMRYSSSAARSLSFIPSRTRAAACSKAPELVRTERRISSISEADFTMRSSSIHPAAGFSDAFMGRRDRSASKASQVMRAGSYPIDDTPSRRIAETTSTTSGPLAILTRQVVSWAAWISKRGSVNRMARPSSNSRLPLSPVKPVR